MIKKKIYLTICLISWLFVLNTIAELICWKIDMNHTQNITNRLQSTFKEEDQSQLHLVNPPEDENDAYWQYIETPFLKVDFTDLLKENTDTVAWIQVNGTSIDYPVVQTDNNDFYLTHSFDKSYNKAGWIFADFRNNYKTWNKNTIIYGHRRLDDTMFTSLKNLLDKNWLTNDPLIKLSMPKENSLWQIFSVYVIPEESYYITTHFENDEQYETFLKTIKNRSIYDFNTSISQNDKILTLSSCKDNNGNRIAVHAKLIKKEDCSS